MGFISNIIQSTKAAAQPSSVVGIDIGSSAMKVVEIEDRNGVLTLVTYGEIQLGPYAEKALGAVVQLDAKQEQAALVDVMRESAVKSRKAVFAMPLSASFISTSNFDLPEDTDLTAQVRIEARKIIPASLSEVTLDWAELDTAKSTETGRQVLIAAIQNTAIERLNILMQFVGLGGSPTEIECFSTGRSVTRTGHTAVIDLGASSAKMYLSYNGVLQRMHRINVGGVQVTQHLAHEEELEFEDAELQKLHRSQTGDKNDLMRAAYNKVYARPLREFKQVLQHYETDRDMTFDVVYVSGGASLYPGFEGLFKDVIGVAIEHINPFKNVAYPAFMEDAMTEIGPSFVPALGAALRNFE